jgi:hypothetical protein
MHARQASVSATLVSLIAILSAAGCGADDTGGSMNPSTIPGAAGTFGPSAAGALGAATAGSNATGFAGGGAAGSSTANSGLAGRSGGLAGSSAAGGLAAGSGGLSGSTAGAAGTLAANGGASGSGTTSPTGAAGAAGAAGATPAMGTGKCCASGDCLCHGPDPMGLTTANGPYKTMSMPAMTGTIYYPTGDAEPPFAAVVLCGGFLNTGPEMEAWAPLYASYGIVTVIVTTTGADLPDVRAQRLIDAVAELQSLNKGTSGPLAGKLAARYGTSGYSMGGGGTTIASGTDPTLKTSVGLAPWGGVGEGVKVPTLLFCGDADTVAPCPMAEGVYGGIPDSTPKMLMTAPGATHFNWFAPTDAGGGMSGKYALAFQKVFLEGDERWKPLLLMKPQGGSQETNIK